MENNFKCENCQFCYFEDLDGKLDCSKGIKNIYCLPIEDGEQYNANDGICKKFIYNFGYNKR